MKQIPILFSTPMVQAILDGRKTQTRRVVKPQPNENGISYMKNAPLDWETIYKEEWKPWKMETEEGETIALHCPYGQPGDVLWVRESTHKTYNCRTKELARYEYKTDMPADYWDRFVPAINNGRKVKWTPSIHMPKAACRIWLKVTGVRVERLYDITEDDAKAEGVEKAYEVYKENARYRLGFMRLWEKINGIVSLNTNPWVWVISFEPCDMPSDFLTAKTN